MIRSSTIFVAFQELKDPRRERNQAYQLFDIVAISILGVLCGADDWITVCLWANSNLSWLQDQGVCIGGVPSHDTMGRFFRYVNSTEFERCFVNWVQLVSQRVQGVIAIDGKTLRNSCDTARENKAIHIVSAFAAQNQLILGQLATDAKSNEITAIPKLLSMLDIRDATVTIDAAGCQKEIVQVIRDKGGDYLVALKGNQGHLHSEAENFFSQALAVEPTEAEYDYAVSEERSHGRSEKRETFVTQEIGWLPQIGDWAGLRTLACVRSTRTVKGQTSVELRYYISSLAADARKIAEGVRAHWGVENKLHWQLDISYGEDRCKVRKDNGPENFSVLRRCTMNLLKKDTKTKAGIKNKRARAGWDRDYLLELLRKC